MGDQEKKKLCWNCEGSVSHTVENCPYCGVYLSPTEFEPETPRSFSPPYPASSGSETASQEAVLASSESQTDQEGQEVISKGYLTSLLMFISGTSFALFGLSLWLFSYKGHLTLSWSSEWGPLFILAALPLLFFGVKNLEK